MGLTQIRSENPRVVGSIPTLATIFKHLAATRGFPLLYRCTNARPGTPGGQSASRRVSYASIEAGSRISDLHTSLADRVAPLVAFARPHVDSLSAAAHSGLKQHRGLQSLLSAKPAHSCACASSRHRSPFAQVGVEFAARSQLLDYTSLTMRYARADLDLKRQAPPQILPDALGCHYSIQNACPGK
jgi:hypothetical protein